MHEKIQINDSIFEFASAQPYYPKYKHIADSLQIPVWQKSDLNGDNKTDLIVMGLSEQKLTSWIILAQENQQFEIYDMNYCSLVDVRFCKPFHIGNQTVILTHTILIDPNNQTKYETYLPNLRTDTLLFYQNYLINYASVQATIQPDTILFETSSPYYILSTLITKDKKTIIYYTEIKHLRDLRFEKTDTLITANLPDSLYAKMLGIISIMNLKEMNQVHNLDSNSSSISIQIRYQDGSTKTILDDGLCQKNMMVLNELFRSILDLPEFDLGK
jgi:hypothetical protein